MTLEFKEPGEPTETKTVEERAEIINCASCAGEVIVKQDQAMSVKVAG